MSNVLTGDFLTIPPLLELDSEAAPSCLLYIYFTKYVKNKKKHEEQTSFFFGTNKMELLQSQAPTERELLGNQPSGH